VRRDPADPRARARGSTARPRRGARTRTSSSRSASASRGSRWSATSTPTVPATSARSTPPAPPTRSGRAIESAVPLRRCTGAWRHRHTRRRSVPPRGARDRRVPVLRRVPGRRLRGHRRPGGTWAVLRAHGRLLDPLERRMHALAADERYEEAAITVTAGGTRPRARPRPTRARGPARRAGARRGRPRHRRHRRRPPGRRPAHAAAVRPRRGAAGRHEIDELLVVAATLFGPTRGTRLVRQADGLLASTFPALPRYAPARTAAPVRSTR